MECFQSTLPEAYIAIEIQSLQEQPLHNLNLDWLDEEEQAHLLEVLDEQRSTYQTVLFVTVKWGSYF